MRLSKFSYYSDFAIYPLVCAGLAAASVRGAGWINGAEWLAALGVGLMLWTLPGVRAAPYRPACDALVCADARRAP